MQKVLSGRTTSVLMAAVVTVASAAWMIAATPAPATGGGSLSPALFRKGLSANGEVVRRDDGATVTRVVVSHHGDRVVLYRVRVAGRFPPRALRYVVTAGGERIAFGVPSPNGAAVLTVTRDKSVLRDRIRARYTGARAVAGAQPPEVAGTQPGMADPGEPGSLEVRRRVYNFGTQVFQPTDIGRKVEITAEVHHPTDLAGGPYPLVLFLHGNHATCFKGRRARFQWPCRDGFKPIPNHFGYGYIGESLASHGFIVASVSTNGVNALGSRLPDTAMRQRGELLDRHLELWSEWSATGAAPFGDDFVGNVDMDRVGTMGHSRGGEGVVWHKIVDDARPDPFGIDAVLSLAPVDFTRMRINGAPHATMLPYCDGDVSDLQGIHFFDDSRYNVPGDPAPKHTVSLFGANHNFFNTVWSPSSRFPGASDDGEFGGCQGKRLGEKRQRRLGRSYTVGFFRRYLEPNVAIDPMWTGEAIPSFTSSAEVLVGYHAPDTATHRRDVVRFTSPTDLRQNHLGGSMLPTSLNRYAWCANSRAAPCLIAREFQRDRHRPGLARGLLGWSTHSALLGMTLPAGSRDVSGFDAFQFRALVPPGYKGNRRITHQDLSVAFIDGDGDVVEVPASDVGNEALVAPGRFRPHYIANQVRFPLDLFAGVDLGDVREVQLRFDRMRAGAIEVSDVAFSSGGAVLPFD